MDMSKLKVKSDERRLLFNGHLGIREMSQLLDVRPVTVRSWILDGVPKAHIQDIVNMAKSKGIDVDPEDLRL